MKFDFTTVNTGGGVHPFVAERGITDPNVISFSVAEMRLNLAPCITEGMHPDCGYRLFWLRAAGKGAL